MVDNVVSLVKKQESSVLQAFNMIKEAVESGSVKTIAAVMVTDNGILRVVSDNIKSRFEIIGAIETLKHDIVPERMLEEDE